MLFEQRICLWIPNFRINAVDDPAGLFLVLLQYLGIAVSADRKLHFHLNGYRSGIPPAADPSWLRLPEMVRILAGNTWGM